MGEFTDKLSPRFSWQLGADRELATRGASQTAYRVQLVDTQTATTAFDSGVVATSEQTHRLAEGEALAPDSQYQLSVTSWDGASTAEPAGTTATGLFRTALGDASGWQGEWIGGGTQLRTEFAPCGHGRIVGDGLCLRHRLLRPDRQRTARGKQQRAGPGLLDRPHRAHAVHGL